MASTATNSNCAAISNFSNQVVWKTKAIHQPMHTTYWDDGEGRLRYRKDVPNVVYMAENTLSIGRRGFKVRVVCNMKVGDVL